MNENDRLLIVGLGNPGEEYAGSRHNAGFCVIDALADDLRVNYWKRECDAEVGHAKMSGCEIILAKPQTFMNLSGNAVRGLCKTYGVSSERVIIIHDELDIPAGTIRVKFGGGHAGHNGLRSICDKLGTRDYYRVRVGVGRPSGRADISRYVLGKPRGGEADNFALAVKMASEAVPFLIQNGLERTQQEYN